MLADGLASAQLEEIVGRRALLVEQLFQADTPEFTWRVPMKRTDATSYSYKVTWFKKDGSRVTTGPVTSHDEILLLDPLAP